MKKLKYLLFIVLVLLTINVKADDKCTSEESTRLRELAKKVEFDYDYELIDNNAEFSIKAVNLNSDLKVLIIEDYYMDKYKEFKNNNTHTATLKGFNSGEKVTVTIKGYVPNGCSGETILTKTIKLPYYNYFHNDEMCIDNEDFKYCKVLLDSNISAKTFYEQYNLYIAEKENNNNENTPVKSNWQLLIIIGSIVIVLAILVIITSSIIRKRKRNSL